jgi:hypothetical protein
MEVRIASVQSELAEPDLRRPLEDRQVRVIVLVTVLVTVLVIPASVSGRRGEGAQPGADAVG